MYTTITAKQLNRLQEIIIEAEPSQKSAQALIENGDILSMLVSACSLSKKDFDMFRGVFKTLRDNRYTNEKVASNFGYPEDYHPMTPQMQIKKLCKFYPKLDGTYIPELALQLGRLRSGEELYQVVPKLSSVARLYGIENPFYSGYQQCLKIMLKNIKKSLHYDDMWHAEEYIKLQPEASSHLSELEKKAPGDFIIIPMQSGKLFAGYSVRNAETEIANSDKQWPLPTWVIGHHLLTHPKRLSRSGLLNIVNVGDVYSSDACGGLSESISFACRKGDLYFCADMFQMTRPNFGSASGFKR